VFELEPAQPGHICDYAGCDRAAVLALRFGKPLLANFRRQTFAFYCHAHSLVVRRTFSTCDERPVSPGT
jgi:hypothetical protein